MELDRPIGALRAAEPDERPPSYGLCVTIRRGLEGASASRLTR